MRITATIEGNESTNKVKNTMTATSGAKKNRFDGLDVAAASSLVHRTLLGRRVVNIYDGTSSGGVGGSGGDGGKSAYVFKLADPAAAAATAASVGKEQGTSASNDGGRAMLLLESGVRFHTTSYHASAAGDNLSSRMPSPFASKLRKHLRNLRLEGCTQLGQLDRVVDFRFGSGDGSHHVLLELYARGNLILADSRYVILALLRTHEYGPSSNGGKTKTAEPDNGGVKVRVGNVYPVTYATTLSANQRQNSNPTDDDPLDPVSDDSNNAESKDERQHRTGFISFSPNDDEENNNEAGLNAMGWAKSELEAAQNRILDGGGGKGKTQGKKKGGGKQVGSMMLKTLLLKPNSGVYHYGPSLIEHCILCSSLDPNLTLSAEKLEEMLPISAWSKLIYSLKHEGAEIIGKLKSGEGGGYILYRSKSGEPSNHEDAKEEKDSHTLPHSAHSDKVFEEFQPHLLRQHANRPRLEYKTFSDAVDEFFSLVEGQRRALRAENAEAAAKDRLNKIRKDQERRMQELGKEGDALRQSAQLVEWHAEAVDNAITVVNSALGSGMDWDALDRLVDVEKRNGNPIALLIQRLELEEEAMVLSLPIEEDSGDDDDEEEKEEKTTNTHVMVSLNQTAHGNARDMYDRYRASKEKSLKTAEASAKAMKAAEATAQRQLAEAQKRRKMTAVVPQRRQHWFEKFHWFITSDNYLVLGGRDAQQNEQLVKRYLRPGDAYLHADVHGASSVILRAKRRRKMPSGETEVLPLSDRALCEAGHFTICKSSAWSSRMVTSAWWVESHQVSKTAPSGEYLTVGSFMVRGKKNFLPASQLEMGMAVLFRLGNDTSIARHANERRDFALLDRETSGDVGFEEFVEMERDTTRNGTLPVMNPNKLMGSESGFDQGPVDKDAKNGMLEAAHTAEEKEEPTPVQKDPDKPPTILEIKEEETSATITKEENETQGVLEMKLLDIDEKRHVSTGDNTGNSSEDIQTKQKKKKKGLSARDRRLLKRYGSLTADELIIAKKNETEDADMEREEASISTIATEFTNEKKGGRQNVATMSRGKKAKMKKLAKKYADQDDEDRELAMQALHGGEKKAKNKGKSGRKGKHTDGGSESLTQQKAAAETVALLMRDGSAVANKLSQEVRDTLGSCITVPIEAGTSVDIDDDDAATGAATIVVRWDKFDANVLEQLLELDSLEAQLAAAKRLLELTQRTRVDNFSSSLAGIIRTIKRYGHESLGGGNGDGESSIAMKGDGKQRKTKAKRQAENEAWKEILAEDGIVDAEGDLDGAVDDTTEIGKLSGKPHPDDVLLYAIPVCAPYQTLSQYKYRVKLTPGSQKRGKASKQCLDMFLHADSGDSSKDRQAGRNRELIKRVNDSEWVQAICGDVKISAPGASKAAKKQKSNNKKGGGKR